MMTMDGLDDHNDLFLFLLNSGHGLAFLVSAWWWLVFGDGALRPTFFFRFSLLLHSSRDLELRQLHSLRNFLVNQYKIFFSIRTIVLCKVKGV